jgi:hypothetical protein
VNGNAKSTSASPGEGVEQEFPTSGGKEPEVPWETTVNRKDKYRARQGQGSSASSQPSKETAPASQMERSAPSQAGRRRVGPEPLPGEVESLQPKNLDKGVGRSSRELGDAQLDNGDHEMIEEGNDQDSLAFNREEESRIDTRVQPAPFTLVDTNGLLTGSAVPSLVGTQDLGPTLAIMNIQHASFSILATPQDRSKAVMLAQPAAADSAFGQPLPVLDLNRKITASNSNMAVVSLGDGSLAFPPQIFISTRRDGVRIRLSCSTPSRTPRTPGRAGAGGSSGFLGPVPEHLANTIHEWLRERGTVSEEGGFRTPQAKRINNIQEARKSHGAEHSSHQRTLAL